MRLSVVSVIAALVLALPAPGRAQGSAAVSGRLLNSLSGDPIAGAVLQIDELKRETTSSSDGAFRFDDVPLGAYHLSVRSQGYSTRRTEVLVSIGGVSGLDILVDPELHFEEVTTVAGEPRSQFDSYQPTAVLAGQDLGKELQMSLGATLESQPGVAARSFGPAPARPVIRGLDGDRVQILQDGQRMGDLSSQSGDHGVAVNPAAAQRIEVVRGPATLLYGANAIGGLVNVITEDIPTRPIERPTGTVTFDLGSAAKEVGTAADIRAGNGRVAIHAGGGGRRSSDVATPEGDLANSQSRNGFGSVGLSWTGERSYVGGSYGYDDTKYGVPVVEDGQVQLTPRRHAVGVRAGAQNLAGAFDSYRATLAVRRYAHDELEGDEIGTSFTNDTEEIELMASHRALGPFKGSVGGSFLNRAFGAAGEESLSPNVDQRAASAFLFEEVTWPHVTLQFGARLDHTRYEPEGEPERNFTNGSASVGVLLRPAAAADRLTMVLSLARAGRNPALEELFYFGPHPGNFAFEVGNPDLRPEHALGFDASLRWRGPRASGEVTYFRNDVKDFVFRSPVSEEDLVARASELALRFPGRDLDFDGEGFPIVENVGADTVLQGIESHADFSLTSELFAEAGIDYTRGTVKATGDPLPRMPPLRTQVGLRYQRNAFQAGANVTVAAKQDRLFEGETLTDGYTLLRLYTAYSVEKGGLLHTITARVDNATNELYRNHLSLIKDLAPEMGRNFRVSYGVRF